VAEELSSLQYQRELKVGEPEQPVAPEAPDLPIETLKVIGWTLVAALGVVALVWLGRVFLDRRPPAEVAEPADEPAGSRRRSPAQLLEEADSLARQGRYGEAAHLLLLGALDALAEAGARFVAPPLTGREVVAQASLRDSAKAALAELVTAVERGRFAGRQTAAEDYDRCRRGFAVIAEDGAAGAGA